MEYDNPAARLLYVVENAKNYPQNQNCLSVWRELIGPAADDFELVARVGKMMSLTGEIIEQLKTHYPAHADSWSHWASQVNLAFMVQDLHGQWGTFRDRFDAHTVNYLRMSSELLNNVHTSKALSPDDVESLREQFSSLLSRVVDADVALPVKQYLLHYLRKILTALDDYRVTGATAILDAVEGMVGHAAVDPQYRQFLRSEELGRSILDGLNAAAALVTVAVGLPQLVQQLVQLISG